MRKLAIWVEVVGLIVTSAGVGIELALHADVGYMLITGGSLFIAAGGLLFSKLLRGQKKG